MNNVLDQTNQNIWNGLAYQIVVKLSDADHWLNTNDAFFGVQRDDAAQVHLDLLEEEINSW